MAVTYSRPSLSSMSTRVAFFAVYVCLTLPILPALAANVVALRWLLMADLFIRGIPLWIAWCVDVAFYDAGELSHAMIPVWVALTGLLLSPLLLLAIRPSLWMSRSWRAAVTAYTVVASIGTVLASVWVFTHLGIFF